MSFRILPYDIKLLFLFAAIKVSPTTLDSLSRISRNLFSTYQLNKATLLRQAYPKLMTIALMRLSKDGAASLINSSELNANILDIHKSFHRLARFLYSLDILGQLQGSAIQRKQYISGVTPILRWIAAIFTVVAEGDPHYHTTPSINSALSYHQSPRDERNAKSFPTPFQRLLELSERTIMSTWRREHKFPPPGRDELMSLKVEPLLKWANGGVQWEWLGDVLGAWDDSWFVWEVTNADEQASRLQAKRAEFGNWWKGMDTKREAAFLKQENVATQPTWGGRVQSIKCVSRAFSGVNPRPFS